MGRDFTFLHTHIGKVRRNSRSCMRWGKKMQRKKGASFRDFFSIVTDVFILLKRLFTLRDTTLISRLTGMFLRKKGRIRAFLESYSIQVSPRERFPQREFFQLSFVPFQPSSESHSNFKIACNKKKSTIFRSFFVLVYGWSACV
jgi:hypothetical protein